MSARRHIALREFAKKIPPLYSLVGLLRYLRFKRQLAAQNRQYEAGHASTIPPPTLRFRVHGALDEASFLQVGEDTAASITSYLERVGVKLQDLDVLDFACGPGRVAIEFKKLASTCRLYGSDIDGEAIGWAQTHLASVGEFAVNSRLPPTRYSSSSFDVIYAISLFTHVDEVTQFAWLEEFSRIAKPGSTVLATVHGELTYENCFPSERKQLREHGFFYRIDRKGKFKLDQLPDSYQTTFHTRDYVMRHWSKWFEVIEYIEAGLQGHQDVVILKRRADIPKNWA
jgi:ubiquinone/menaquinone biosynthesis C-methylase UbiE